MLLLTYFNCGRENDVKNKKFKNVCGIKELCNAELLVIKHILN